MALSLLPERGAATPTRPDTLRVAVVLPDGPGHRGAAAVRRGVTLGAEEAVRTAALFDLAVIVTLERSGGAPDEAARVAGRLAERRVSAIIGALDDAMCRDLAALATEQRILFVGLGCTPHADDHDICHRLVLYVQPGGTTSRRARDAYGRQAEKEDARTRSPRIAVWHHALRRFGAEQLNERFRRRFGTEMDSDAWGGWVAVKILTEAALRGRSAAPRDLARYLARPGARFDGHKGEPLAFDARTGELRQPLYVVADTAAGDVRPRLLAELSAETLFGPPQAGRRGSSVCHGASAPRLR